MKLIFIAAPNAGKGTIAKKLSEEYKIPHISTGDIFRDAIARETDLGKRVKEYMSKNELVPDDVVISVVKERLAKQDCKKGYILDGFPRTVAQAEAFGTSIDSIIELTVPEKELLKRASERRVCETCKDVYGIGHQPKKRMICDNDGTKLTQRKDDLPDEARKRLLDYRKLTIPVLGFYERFGLLSKINGVGSINEVYARVKKAVSKYAK